MRVVEALDAILMQHNRRTAEGRYRPPDAMPAVEHVVLLRDPRAIESLRRLFPNARIHLWLHDLMAPGSTRARWLAGADAALATAGGAVICVSDFLQQRVEAVLRNLARSSAVELRTIFNPIDDALDRDGSSVDPQKLIFLSSPNKGLGYSLAAFQAVRRAFPGMRLCVANPGYRALQPIALPDVEWLGILPPARAFAEARSALAVFMPNFVLLETFGLVFAEANAVGTPVIAHDCGAAREVLHPRNPVLPVHGGQRRFERFTAPLGWRTKLSLAGVARRLSIFDDYVETLRAWRGGARPLVSADPRFRISRVAQDWQELFA
ncbi:MAG TPA: glycosyltransferase [Steroidobacteraceae bacterium]|nr:glycosyltransferase [Steroidobacteraceae bacterium]